MLKNALSAEKTHMLNEIQEQPAALRRALQGSVAAVQQVALEVQQRNVDLVILAARGTSDHAALYAQYLFQYLNGIPVALATQYTLLCHAGPERSVAATKTYTTTCAILAMLAAFMSGGEALREGIEHIPDLVSAALKSEEIISSVALRYVHARDCVVLGRTFQYSTARETALKLEETCYVVSIPFSTADFRHGPAALVERGLPVVLFAPPGHTSSDSYELLQWLQERGADCLVIAEEERLLELATVAVPLKLPTFSTAITHGGGARAAGSNPSQDIHTTIAELLAPLPYIVPGQLLAHYLALHKGLNPDQPRSLTKITRTR